MNASIQTLAKQAKNRLKSGYWNEFSKERDELKRSAAGANASQIDEIFKRRARAEAFSGAEFRRAESEYDAVCKALGSGRDVNPVALLIDAEYYRLSDEESRQRYLLNLVERFNKHKKRYMREFGNIA